MQYVIVPFFVFPESHFIGLIWTSCYVPKIIAFW